MEEIPQWVSSALGVLIVAGGIFRVIVSLILMDGLRIYRRQLIPEIVNIVWAMSLFFLFDGIQRFLIVGVAVATWGITLLVWELLIDLIELGLFLLLGNSRRMLIEIATLNAQRWAATVLEEPHE